MSNIFLRPRGVKEGLAAGYVLLRIVEKLIKQGDCWVWPGKGKRYPVLDLANHRWPERTVSLHRLVFDLCVGDIPDGLHVLHHCDNMRCLRPDHLFVGTNKDNIDDKVAKGRQASGNVVRRNHDHVCGEGVGTSRLTEVIVRRIRSRVANGEKQKRVAEDEGVSRAQVCSIVNRQSWAHLE